MQRLLGKDLVWLRSVWSNRLETTGETRASVCLMANLRSADEKPVSTQHHILPSNPVILFVLFLTPISFGDYPVKKLTTPAHPSRTLSSIASLWPSTSPSAFLLPISFAFPHFHHWLSLPISPPFPCFGYVKGGFISRPEWCRSTGGMDNGPIIRGKQSPWKRNKDPSA